MNAPAPHQPWIPLLLALLLGSSVAKALPPHEAPRTFRDEAEFLELLQRTAFDYFWEEANPVNGLVRDRSTASSKCSIAAVGFGLSAISIGVDHGWIDRTAGRERVRRTLHTFLDSPQSDATEGTIGTRGWFYHFLEMDTARRAWKCELSSIDTALFLAGALDASEYFALDVPEEREIRDAVERLIARIDWRWMMNRGDTFSMGWHPERGFIRRRWTGYNEGMILYVLALGAPGSPVGRRAWDAWTEDYQWETHYGRTFLVFPPLFGHQYSHCWIDFRGKQDAWMRRHGSDYFMNSRQATLAQRAYAIENPLGHAGYGPLLWGLTACDGPGGKGYFDYAARGAPPPEMDDGTIAPTALGGSMPFAPEVCLPALRHIYETYRERIWTRYGFRDAFNPRLDWFDPDVLGIDQGPILVMIENHRTGAVWRRMMKNEIIQRGLRLAGFRPAK